jgi:hypothetical protein
MSAAHMKLQGSSVAINRNMRLLHGYRFEPKHMQCSSALQHTSGATDTAVAATFRAT